MRNKDLSIAEFETIVTTRVLSIFWRKFREEDYIESCNKHDLLGDFSQAINDTLKDFGYEKELSTRLRAGRLFIIYNPTDKVAAQVVIDGLYKGNQVKRPKAILTSRKGYLRSRTLNDMIHWVATADERRQLWQQHQRKFTHR